MLKLILNVIEFHYYIWKAYFLNTNIMSFESLKFREMGSNYHPNYTTENCLDQAPDAVSQL